MAIVKYSTGKPYVDEMRVINGVVMVWTGTKWITEREWERIYSLKPVAQ
jgi:hypothetical protein